MTSNNLPPLDLATSISLKGWTPKENNKNNTSFVIPGGNLFTVPNSEEEWKQVLDYTVATDRLWGFSLKYAWWFKLQGYHDRAIEIIKSYYSNSNEASTLFEESLPGSWDHAVALRLQVLACMIPSANNHEAEILERFIKREIEWAEKPGHIKMNNHGFMLVDSLIVSSLALLNINEVTSRTVLVFAQTKLSQILNSVFGEDYYCNENSPFYAHFYVHKMKQMKQNYSQYPSLTEITEVLTSYINSTQVTLGNIIYSDGQIPPLGDSSKMNTMYESNMGTHFSVRTGFWVHKTENLYLSFKCGHQTLVHKHADDTSITLQVRGEDFIIDSGTCNYDYSDKRILGLRTQAAHSGLFFPKFDNLHPARIYRKPHFSQAGIKVTGPNEVAGWSVTSTSNFAHRELKVISDKEFLIRDSYYSKSDLSPIQRFIVPHSVKIDIEDMIIVLTGKKTKVTLKFTSPINVSVVRGTEDAGSKGWISMSPNTLTSAQCLEVHSSKIGSLPSIKVSID